jgi:hypothetical protein
MAQVSQGTNNHKIKYRAIIVELFPQFNENDTLISECISRDALSHMSSLCTTIQQTHVDQTPDDRWSHIVSLLNEALVKRIHAKGTDKDIPSAAYSLKSEDFRDAHHAAKTRTANLASLFAMTKELEMIEGPDGIMVRNAVLPSNRARPAQSANATLLRPTSRRPDQRDNDPPQRQSPAPSGPTAVTERQQRTYFNSQRYSDLTIVLSDRPVYVHRVVLCAVSDYFDSLFEDSDQVC